MQGLFIFCLPSSHSTLTLNATAGQIFCCSLPSLTNICLSLIYPELMNVRGSFRLANVDFLLRGGGVLAQVENISFEPDDLGLEKPSRMNLNDAF